MVYIHSSVCVCVCVFLELLKFIVLNERNQTQKVAYPMIPLIGLSGKGKRKIIWVENGSVVAGSGVNLREFWG